MEKLKIIIMGSWNTDGGVSRHTTPVAEWLMERGYDIQVFTHYKECAHGYPLDVEDEEFVHRCFTAYSKKIPGKNSFDPEPLLKAVEQEGYNIFFAEDLGILPMEGLLEVFPRIKAKAKTILLNHDNTPKPDDSPFWKFDWDAIANFLPEQDGFMKEHYPAEKVHCTQFPAYAASRGDRIECCEKLNLPTDRNIILTFGEYNMIDFLPAVCKMKKNDPSIYLLAHVYDEERKGKLEVQIAEMKKTNPDIGYDEIRVENGSWKKRRDYVQASKIIIFDKGEGVTGSGAILSSTAYQVIGWGTPILARDNLFFSPFCNGEIVKYSTDAELTKAVQALLYDDKAREKVIAGADEFAEKHSPGRTASIFLELFNTLIHQGKLKRYAGNPILEPIKEHSWESELVYNPAAIRIKGKTYLAYRALGSDGINRIGLAITADGYNIDERLPGPTLEPGEGEFPDPEILNERKREKGGYEDPRMFIIGDRVYMTYVLFGNTCQGMLSSIGIKDFLARNWYAWQNHGLIFPDFDERGAVIFEYMDNAGKKKYGSYHRDTETKSINFASAAEIKAPWPIDGDRAVLLPGAPGSWDDGKGGRLGTGSQVLKTEYGWLSFYHAHRRDEFSGKRVYRLGVFLSSMDDPARIIYRSHIPVLAPEEDYEINGWVNNVVFTCGAVPKKKNSGEILKKDDEIIIYYAGTDSVIGVAEAKLSDIVPA
ncbi:MAG: hypothetical protein KAU17_03675 [Spirochaetales bacterium]|nr:hypothetical protein [Spirochaetales bacterium]